MIFLKKIVKVANERVTLNKEPLKALLIEDNQDVRNILKQFLENKHYIVIEAEDGETGLNKYNSERPDIVFLDLGLPGISGKDVLAEIQSSSADIPKIMISGLGQRDDVIDTMRLGAYDYLIKPVTSEMFDFSLRRAESYMYFQKLVKEYQRNLEVDVREKTIELAKKNEELKKINEDLAWTIKLLEIEKNASQTLETRHNFFLKNSDEGMILFIDDHIDDISPAALKMLEVSFDQLQKGGLLNYVADNYKSYLIEELGKKVEETEKTFDLEFVLNNGKQFYAETRIIFVNDNALKIKGKMIKFWDVSKRLEHHLTRLPGQVIFDDRLCSALHHGRKINHGKEQKVSMAIFYLDLKGFKHINDTRGHAYGDEQLKKVAEILKKHIVRKTDTAAHPHGDEFYLLYPEIRDNKDINRLMISLQKKFREANINVSIGGYIYDFSWQPEIPEESRGSSREKQVKRDKALVKQLLEMAEKQMYLAKNYENIISPVVIDGILIEE